MFLNSRQIQQMYMHVFIQTEHVCGTENRCRYYI